jgi:hypothetical protein
VVDDVHELLLEQAHVQRVQHGAGARDRHVELEVTLVVPRECPHAVALLDAQAAERMRNAVHPLGELAVAHALDRALGRDADDLRPEIARAHPWIRSTDSAKPFVYAMRDIVLNPDEPAPQYPRRPEGYFDLHMTPAQRVKAHKNATTFKAVSSGSRDQAVRL